MKEKKPFKVGATYKLNRDAIAYFNRTRDIISKYGDDVFKFTVAKLDCDGDAIDADGLLVACNNSERHLFTRIDNKQGEQDETI